MSFIRCFSLCMTWFWLLILLQVGFVVDAQVRDVSRLGLGASRKLFPFFLFLSPWLLISSGKKAVHSAVKEKIVTRNGKGQGSKAEGASE